MDKYQQAIYNFRVTKPLGHLLDETKLLQELVDLRTPMKVDVSTITDDKMFKCPKCGKEAHLYIGGELPYYCIEYDCGQAFDWDNG